MGFWDPENISVVSRKSHSGKTKYEVRKGPKKSESRSRSRSPRRERGSSSIFGGGGGRHRSRSPRREQSGLSSIFGGGDKRSHSKHRNSSKGSFFNLAGGGGSRSSLFGGLGGLGRSSSSSYYKRSPRKNFISRALKKLKHLLRDLIRHAKRHPFRVFMLAIVPLVACGALTALLARFGLKLPAYVERLITTAGKAATGDSVGLVGEAVKMVGGLTGGGNKERGDSRGRGGGDDGFSFERKEEGMFSGMGGMGALSGLSGLAKVF